MTDDDIARVTAARLSEWGNRLIAAHATPILPIGVGHDRAKGEIHLCLPEDAPTPCFCPRCSHPHACVVPPAEGERRLADGRLLRACLACAIQGVYETKKGLDS